MLYITLTQRGFIVAAECAFRDKIAHVHVHVHAIMIASLLSLRHLQSDMGSIILKSNILQLPLLGNYFYYYYYYMDK